MNNKSNFILYTVIILAVSFYAFLTGCGGSSSTNPTMVYYGDSSSTLTPQTINVNITNNGKVVKTISPSGKMTLEAPEENTYDSDVLLKITESPSVGNESSLLTVGSIIYGVTATKNGSPVNLLNHPLNLTFSNEEKLNGAETYYIGIKDINGGDWQFVNVYSPNPSSRTSIGSTNQFTYSIYKNNVLIALFADLKKVLQNTPQVLGVIATLTPSIVSVENSAYTEDLKVNLLLSGENLSGLSADSFKIKVAYLTSDSRDTLLKVDGIPVNHISGSGSNQYEASGQSYAHYFQFLPLNTKYTAGFAPSISFDVNLKDVALAGFPNNFIVEISNNNSSILPFAYSTFLVFGRTGSGTNTDTNTNTNTNTGTNTGTSTGTNTDTKTIISLKSPSVGFPVEGSKVVLEFSEDIVWNDADKAKITIDNNAVINDYSYSNKELSLTFKDRLAYNTTYVIKVTDLAGVENATLVFKTADIGTVSLKSAATDFQVSNNNIELEFSTDIPWTLADKAKISIDNNVEISDYSYSNKVLSLTLRQRLKFNSTYLIKVTDLASIENNTLVLKTEAPAEVSLKSSSENLPVNSVVELEFSKDIPITNEDITKILIDNNAVISDFTYSNKVLGLRFQGKLNYDTEYTILFNGFDAVTENTTLKFKTQSHVATPVLNVMEESIKTKLNNRVVLQPKFYIDFGKPIASTSLALANFKLNGNDLPDGCSLDFERNMQNAILSFSSDLESFTDYKLSITSYSDEDNALINTDEIAFKTVPPVDITGAGTIDDPFCKYCEAHLRKLNEMSPVNYRCGSYFFKQMDDITIYDEWVPIGEMYYDQFNGNYNGNNKTIYDLKISDGSYCSALFNTVKNGSISNLNFKKVNILGDYYSCVLCGNLSDSIVENINIEGDISINTKTTGNTNSAFIAYAENSTIRKVNLTGKIEVCKDVVSTGNYLGGLIGYVVNCDISDCYVDSPEGYLKGAANVGGLLGYVTKSKITNCYARINVQSDNLGVGGLIGFGTNLTVNNCYSDCQIKILITYLYGSSYSYGGLIGDMYTSTLSNCYASGTLLLDCYKSNSVGTLIGCITSSDTQINNSFTSVNISVGENYAYSGETACYNPDNAGKSLWYDQSTLAYVYNSNGTNYFGAGYKTTLDWNTAYWHNLVEGGFPKLIEFQNR